MVESLQALHTWIVHTCTLFNCHWFDLFKSFTEFCGYCHTGQIYAMIFINVVVTTHQVFCP